MDIFELMKARHAVRQYTTKSIEQEKRTELTKLAEECNEQSGLHIQIFFDEPKCFGGRSGDFKDCQNYIAIVGKKSDGNLDENAGYYGEKIVLKAQELGLNTCWVGVTHGKTVAKVNPGEREVIVIALGYGANQGVPHKSKSLSAVSNVTENLPEWYAKGLEAALLAPTALNQQHFSFILNGDTVRLDPGNGYYPMLDAGIVKYHFETISGHKVQ